MMHAFGAVVAFVAFVFYADRSGWLFVHGTQSRWAVVTRLGVGSVFVFLAFAFIDLAIADAPFEVRHWLVLLALIVTVSGHIGLRFADPRGPQSPT